MHDWTTALVIVTLAGGILALAGLTGTLPAAPTLLLALCLLLLLLSLLPPHAQRTRHRSLR